MMTITYLLLLLLTMKLDDDNLLVGNMWIFVTSSNCEAQTALERWTLGSLEGSLKKRGGKIFKMNSSQLLAVPLGGI